MKNTQAAVFVLYDRDKGSEAGLRKMCKGRQMYDSYRGFQDLRKARQFARSNIYNGAILSAACPSKFPEAKPKNPEKPYVVALYFEGKYGSHDYGGGDDSIPTKQGFRSAGGGFEETIKKKTEK